MLTGSYKHHIDEKGRCVLPKGLRYGLSEAIVVTRGVDGCVWVLSADRWLEFAMQIEGRAAAGGDGLTLARYFLGGASRVAVDGMGRIPIPAVLREWAGLSGEIILVGVGDHVEIWSPDRWDAAMSKITEQMFRDAGL